MRLLFRFLSLIALVVAVIAGVIDAIQSVAADRLVLTPLRAAWSDVSPATLAALEDWVLAHLPAAFWDPGLRLILGQPATAVLLALAFLLYLLGHRRRQRASRFSWRR